MYTLLRVAAVVVALLIPCQGAQKREVSMTLDRPLAALDSLAEHLNLDPQTGFMPGALAPTAKGHGRLRVRQTYGGLEVLGAAAGVEVTPEGEVRGGVSGSLADNLHHDIPDPNACRRDPDVIKDRVRRYLEAEQAVSISPGMQMTEFRAEVKVDIPGEEDHASPAKLVYEVEFFLNLDPTPSRPFFHLDACDPDLAIIRYFDMVHTTRLPLNRGRHHDHNHGNTTQGVVEGALDRLCPASSSQAKGEGGNAKTGRRQYGNDRPFCLAAAVSGTKCTLSSKHAQVIDAKTTTTLSYPPVEFDCKVGYRDAVNGAYGVANDAFFFAHSAGLMFKQWYKYDPLGYTPKVYVHYRNCYENGIWDGGNILFGDGCNVYYPLVSQDFVGHELGHGITARNSKLYRGGQPGAINEAFSDMSGEVAEAFTYGFNDWMFAHSVTKSSLPVRFLDLPSMDGRSIDSANHYRFSEYGHFNCGVFNRAFYQLVKVQGLRLRKAYEVFLQANRVIWVRSTQFQDGACGVMKAAYDLGYDVNKVKNAFAVVDIDLSSCNFQSFQQTMAEGESRRGVLVSNLRNPVFTLGEGVGANVTIDVQSETNTQVTVSVTSDAAGSNIIVGGPAPFTFQVTSETGFFKLSTSQDSDITLGLTMKAAD